MNSLGESENIPPNRYGKNVWFCCFLQCGTDKNLSDQQTTF